MDDGRLHVALHLGLLIVAAALFGIWQVSWVAGLWFLFVVWWAAAFVQWEIEIILKCALKQRDSAPL